MEMKRCAIRLCPKITIEDVIKEVDDECDLKCLIVTRNKENGSEVILKIIQYCLLSSKYKTNFLHQNLLING